MKSANAKDYFLGALVALITPQLIGISAVTGIYAVAGISAIGTGGIGPGMGGPDAILGLIAMAGIIAMVTGPSTLAYALVMSGLFCKKSWTRRTWPAIGAGTATATVIFWLTLALFFSASPANLDSSALLVFAVVWLIALVPGGLTGWVLNRFFKILDRRALENQSA